MSVTKELIEQEQLLVQAGNIAEVHLHREGTFLRAYEWSAWLCCHYFQASRCRPSLYSPRYQVLV